MNFYNVLLPVAVKGGFVYSSKEYIESGKRVSVPFRGKSKIGIVWDKTQDTHKYDIKEISYVLDDKPIIGKELKKTVEFISYYYMTFLGLVLKATLPKKAFEVDKSIDLHKQVNTPINIYQGHFLNKEQQYIYDNLEQNRFNVNLIFGVTGSGKTEVYMKIMEDVLKRDKKCIVLVPEIVLTPQYIDVFSNRFSSDVISVIHSRLTQKRRFDNWLDFKNSKKRILIGTRSAVFSDFEDVGLVVVDEENDESYKQENEPRYNAKDVAIYRAKQNNIPIILCSATPTLETYHKALYGKFRFFRLRKRIKNIPLPNVNIIHTNPGEILAKQTVKEIKEVLNKNKTVAVLVNRRGFANYLVCSDCGYLFLCPNCSVSLTYHKKTNDLKCHWCESSFQLPSVCPKCGGLNILSKGVGSQQVESVLKELFADKDIERFDRDSVLTKKEFDRIVGKLQKGEIDILVGTQMLSKGHDISKIGLVVILSMEELFGFPDFRAKEKALSLIIQTAGRSGRQEVGSVIVQTISEKGEMLDYIKRHDYEAFLKKEIENRKIFQYPPFGRLIRIIVESRKDEVAKKIAGEVVDLLGKDIDVLGPSTCPIYKLRNHYRYHILIKTTNIMSTVGLLNNKIDGFGAKVHFDVDPISFF